MRSTKVKVPSPNPDFRFRDAMPKPLLLAFSVAGVAALVVAVILLVSPPQPSELPLGQRRSPPDGSLTHDVGRIVPGPLPGTVPAYAPPCAEVGSLAIEAGAAGQSRLGAAVKDLCRLTGPSVAVELRDAIRGLAGATIRFAGFERTGEEAVTDLPARRIWINLRFARANTPTVLVAPIIAHEGWHLAHASEPMTARAELAARRAELEACKQLIDRDKWIRNCNDAAELGSMSEERAIALLVAAGYPR